MHNIIIIAIIIADKPVASLATHSAYLKNTSNEKKTRPGSVNQHQVSTCPLVSMNKVKQLALNEMNSILNANSRVLNKKDGNLVMLLCLRYQYNTQKHLWTQRQLVKKHKTFFFFCAE